jgi:phasin family protein
MDTIAASDFGRSRISFHMVAFRRHGGNSVSQDFDSLQFFVKNQFNAARAFNGAWTQGVSRIANETFSYSRASLQSNADLMKKLAAVKSFDEAIQLQAEHAKATYESSVATTKKLGEMFAELSKAALDTVGANGGAKNAFAKAPSLGKSARVA